MRLLGALFVSVGLALALFAPDKTRSPDIEFAVSHVFEKRGLWKLSDVACRSKAHPEYFCEIRANQWPENIRGRLPSGELVLPDHFWMRVSAHY